MSFVQCVCTSVFANHARSLPTAIIPALVCVCTHWSAIRKHADTCVLAAPACETQRLFAVLYGNGTFCSAAHVHACMWWRIVLKTTYYKRIAIKITLVHSLTHAHAVTPNGWCAWIETRIVFTKRYVTGIAWFRFSAQCNISAEYTQRTLCLRQCVSARK